MPGCTGCSNGNWVKPVAQHPQQHITNHDTGATRPNLPLVSLLRSPSIRSGVRSSIRMRTPRTQLVYAQRYYGQASLRILLSDRVADFTGSAADRRRQPGNPALLNGVDGAAGSWTNAPPVITVRWTRRIRRLRGRSDRRARRPPPTATNGRRPADSGYIRRHRLLST